MLGEVVVLRRILRSAQNDGKDKSKASCEYNDSGDDKGNSNSSGNRKEGMTRAQQGEGCSCGAPGYFGLRVRMCLVAALVAATLKGMGKVLPLYQAGH